MRLWLAALALFAAPAAASAQPRDPAMDAAVRDLCHRQVAMLGEASHGDGATFAFKTRLIRRLVNECGYNAVFFEAGIYDFLELTRRLRAHEPATQAMLSSAVGGLWNRFAEMAPLLQFLFEQAQAGRLHLGGIDDQIGSVGAFFSNDDMQQLLTAGLPPARRDECRALMHRRLYWQYDDTQHHDAPEVARRQACLVDMGAAVVRAGGRERAARAQMIANMQSALAREFMEGDALTRGRDLAMYRNLRWLAARLGPRAKIIIWTHNVHLARDASSGTSFPNGGNLGAYMHRAYGTRAFALGFSAYGGSWHSVFVREDTALPQAPAGSLEALAMADVAGDSVYRGAPWLARTGRIPGRPFNYVYAPADWGRVFDGLVVFRAERPPVRTR
jgi:erythromycin esterase-like protein